MVDRLQRFRSPPLPTKDEDRRDYASDYPDRAVGADGMAMAREGYTTIERDNQMPGDGFYGMGRDAPARGTQPVYDGPDVPWDERMPARTVY